VDVIIEIFAKNCNNITSVLLPIFILRRFEKAEEDIKRLKGKGIKKALSIL